MDDVKEGRQFRKSTGREVKIRRRGRESERSE